MQEKISLVALGVVAGMSLSIGTAAAQTINPKATEKVRWHNAPRQFHIIDDRPIIRDFREAPVAPQGIQLPPPPQGFGGMGGGGAGGMGPDGMGDTLPAGGLPLKGSMPGGAYRSDPAMLGNSLPLPKSGFGGSNIPARGMAPKGPLPGGFTTGIHGKVMPNTNTNNIPGVGAGTANRAAGRSPAAAAPQAPSAASYSGAYGTGSGSGYGSGGQNTQTSVHGYLLNRNKGK